MKKLMVVILSILYLVLGTTSVKAEDETIICPQPYGGGVVCGVKTHTPVDTGLGENIALIGVSAIGLSGIFLRISKKVRS